MTKSRSLVKHRKHRKHRRTAKHKRTTKHKRTAKHKRSAKHKRMVKHRRTVKHRRYGGDQQFTVAERKVVIEEFKAYIPLLQGAVKTKSNQLDLIVEFYTFIKQNANPLLKIESFRKILFDKMSDIESQENIWFDPIYRNENNGNLNTLKSQYFKLKEELQDLSEKYSKLY